MTNKDLKLNFPDGGGDVFDSNNNELFFSFSGSFSNTTNNIKNLSIEQFEKHIPFGYKSIYICRRLKLIESGMSTIELDYTEKENFMLFTSDNYKLFVPNWKREIDTTVIYKPGFLDLSLMSSMWDNIYECEKYGFEYSKINRCQVLVASVIDTINWH